MWLEQNLLAVLCFTLTAAQDSGCRKPKITIPGAITDEYGPDVVQEGPVEVFCSSDEVINLVFKASETIHTEEVNATTVKARVTPSSRMFTIKCISNVECSVSKLVTVSYKPNIANFKCFSNNFETLNCSWNSHSFVNNYSLTLFSSWDGNVKCRGLIDRRQYYSCLWDLSDVRRLRDAHSRPLSVPLEFEMCNVFECIYQSFHVDLITVTKLNAPLIFDVQANGTDAILTWNIQVGSVTLPSYMEIYYVIEYAFAGLEPRVLISDTTEFSTYDTYTNDLILPCPGKQYTVRISCRLVESPPEYMSDFAYTSVRTEPDISTALDPICKLKPIDLNPPVMKYKVQVLRQLVEDKLQEYEKLKVNLQEKIALSKITLSS